MTPFGPTRWLVFLCVVGLYLTHALWTVAVLPLTLGADEREHFDYAHYLEFERRLPDPRTEDVGQIQHPPFPYTVYGATLHGLLTLDRSLPTDAFDHRDWSRIAGRVTTFDPGRTFAEEYKILPQTPDARKNDMLRARRWVFYALRLVPVILGAATLFLLLGAARRIAPDSPTIALLAVTGAATTVQYPIHFSTVSNDAFMTFAGALYAYVVLAARERGRLLEMRTLLLLSLIGAFGFLVKLHFIGMALFAAMMILSEPAPMARRVRALFVIGAGPVLLAAWWHIRQIMLQGSLLALQQHAEYRGFLFRLSPWHPMAILEFFSKTLESFFGTIGHDLVKAPDLYYSVTGGIAAASLFGCLFLKGKPIPPAPESTEATPQRSSSALAMRAALASLALLVVLLNVSNVLYYHDHGRYMMAVLVPLLIIYIEGLRRLVGPRILPLLGMVVLWNLAFVAPTYFGILAAKYGLPLEKFDRGRVVRYIDCGNSRPEFDDPSAGGRIYNAPFSILSKPEFTSRFAFQSGEAPGLSYEVKGLDASKRYQIRIRYPDALGRDGSELPIPTANALLVDSWMVHGPLSFWHVFGDMHWPLPEPTTADGKIRLWWENHTRVTNIVGASEIWVEESWLTLDGEPRIEGEGTEPRVIVTLANIDPEAPHLASLFVVQDQSALGERRQILMPPESSQSISIPLAKDVAFDRTRLRVRVIDGDAGPYADLKLAFYALAPGGTRGGDHDVPDIDVLRIRCDPEKPVDVAHVPIPRVTGGTYLVSVTHSRRFDPFGTKSLSLTSAEGTISEHPITTTAHYGKNLARTTFLFTKTAPEEGTVTITLRAAAGPADTAIEVDRITLHRDATPFAWGHEWQVR